MTWLDRADGARTLQLVAAEGQMTAGVSTQDMEWAATALPPNLAAHFGRMMARPAVQRMLAEGLAA